MTDEDIREARLARALTEWETAHGRTIVAVDELVEATVHLIREDRRLT